MKDHEVGIFPLDALAPKITQLAHPKGRGGGGVRMVT